MSEFTRILESDDPCDNLELLDPHLRLGGEVSALRFVRHILAGESQVTLSNVKSVPLPARPGVVEEFNVALTEMCLPFLREAEEDIGRHLRMLSAELTVRVGAVVRSGAPITSPPLGTAAPEPPKPYLPPAVRQRVAVMQKAVDSLYPSSKVQQRALGWLHGFEGEKPDPSMEDDALRDAYEEGWLEGVENATHLAASEEPPR